MTRTPEPGGARWRAPRGHSVGDKLRIALDARILPGGSGGVGTAVATLVRDLGRLDDGTEEYAVVVESEAQRDWLRPLIGPNQTLVMRPPHRERWYLPQAVRHLDVPVKRALGPLLPTMRHARRMISRPRRPVWPTVPISDGFLEALGCDVLHIPTKHFILCSIPTVYNPHDVQHLHYPQFFPQDELAFRETVYTTGLRCARLVVVGSAFVKDDLIRQYGVSPTKVQVIPEGSPTEGSPEPTAELLESIRRTYRLETPFIFYPAVTWPHKNHLRLLEALAQLRQRHGLRIPLVCTGALWAGFWPKIERRVQELGLTEQVRFLGFVPQSHMRGLHRLAEAMVQPSLFEASSLPIFEAWQEGTPVACADATALPDQVGDAGLLFDPRSVESIADALLQLWRDESLRAKLIVRGHERLSDFSCERTARAYRAAYRRLAEHPLSEEDRYLLGWDWMRERGRKPEASQ